MEKELIYQIVVKGGDNLIRLEEQQNRLKAQKEELKQGVQLGAVGTEEYKKAQKEIFETTQKVKALRLELREQEKAFKSAQYPAGSYNALNADLNKLRTSYKNLSDTETKSAKEMLANIQKLDTKLKDVDKTMGQYQRNVGNYKEAFTRAFSNVSPQLGELVSSFTSGGGMMAAGIGLAIAAVTALIAGIKEAIAVNARMSDIKIDVGIATGKTKAEVDALVESLKKIDTRTALEELLAFAEIGGKQGVTKNLEDFVLSVDKIKIALGKELGANAEETITDLTKIINIFFRGQIDASNGKQVGDLLERIGNGIKYLANQGVASGAYITEFTTDLAGLRSLLGDKLTLGEVIGLGAGFEELGVKATVATTAISQIVQKIGQDIPKFAKLAGISAKEFTEIYEKSPVQAMLLLANNTKNANSTLVELEAAMGDAEFRGAKVTQVFGAMAGNTDAFNEKIKQGTKGLSENSLTTDGYIAKQETLQGVIDRTGNTLKESFINSGFENFLKSAISLVGGFANGMLALSVNTLEAVKEITGFTYLWNTFGKGSNSLNQRDVNKIVNAADSFNPLLGRKATGEGILTDPSKFDSFQKKVTFKKSVDFDKDDLTDKQIKAAEKLAKQTDNLAEKQKRRIEEIIKDTQRLNAIELTNIFDKKIQDSINKADSETTQLEQRIRDLKEKGKAQGFKVSGNGINGNVSVNGGNAQDRQEAQLINAETAAIKAALARQKDEIEKDRKAAFEKQRQKIEQYANELRGIQLQVAKDDLQLTKKNIFDGLDERIVKVKDAFEDERTLLIAELDSKSITQKQYNERIYELEVAARERILNIQRNRLSDVEKINSDILVQERIFETEKVRLKTASINDKLKQDEIKVADDLKAGRIENEAAANEEIKALRQRAIFDIERLEKDSKDALNKNAEGAKKDEIAIAKDIKDAKIALNNEEYQHAKEQTEKKKKDAQELRDTGIGIANELNKGIAQISNNRINNEKEESLSNVDFEYKAKIEAARGNAVEQERLQKELEAKKSEIEKEAAEKRKQVAIKEAIIGGILATIKAAPNPFAMAAVAASTLISLAVIKSQKFERGTVMRLGDGTQMATIGGKKHTEGGTKLYTEYGQFLGEAERGENIAIVNARNSARMSQLSAINSYGGHGDAFFERGGTIPTYFLNSALAASTPSQSDFNGAISIDRKSVLVLANEIAIRTGEKTYSGTRRGVVDANRDNEKNNRNLRNSIF